MYDNKKRRDEKERKIASRNWSGKQDDVPVPLPFALSLSLSLPDLSLLVMQAEAYAGYSQDIDFG